MPWLVEPRHLLRAARLCMRRAGGPGADGMTWRAFRVDLHHRLADLGQALRAGTWQPGPMRLVEIPAYTGKVFTAVLPTVTDRVVHRAMRQALAGVLETRVLADWVSAYRPRRSRVTALRQAARHRADGFAWVTDLDVAGASAGGDVGELVDWLAAHVADGAFLDRFRTALTGLPSPLMPGSGVWPVVFHLRLSRVDEQLAGLRVVRFADNYAVFSVDEPAAVAAFEQVTAALAAVGLAANARKSRIRPPAHALIEDLFLIDG
ncbi:reverse transcriptase domain-containing protein [Longispora fulva]|uniref:Reverse transcriptase domain-containing protein n=1 Tax=Longispora fulva TaxID=619741 RepID=A0A8J7KNN6_9ACTN|nr:reverse transcriptase domain-containing protein [Longispora fulva]MBG6140451.1 hypothetical protein [Longispora fulva]